MRETKKFKTQGGNEVEIYTYITGGEAREISNVFLEGMKFKVDQTGATQSNELNANLANKAQDKAIEKLVVSIDGKKENILKEVLNLPNPDFVEVIREIDKIQTGLTEEKKTN